MEPETKFKVTTFLKYLVIEPFTEKVALPNFSTIVWVLIVISVALKIPVLLWISIVAGVIFYGFKEYKSGKYIHWYRVYKKEKIAKEIKKNSPQTKPEKKPSVLDAITPPISEQDNSEFNENRINGRDKTADNTQDVKKEMS